jgi:ElaB/YqjD/DUF883 family membrane-anchored ribosome-binding protein
MFSISGDSSELFRIAGTSIRPGFGAPAGFQRRDGEPTAGRQVSEAAQVRHPRGVCDRKHTLSGTPDAVKNRVLVAKLKKEFFMSTFTSLLDDKASRLAEQVDNLGRGTSRSLHAAASSIRKGSKALEDLAGDTASRLDDAGSYVGKHTVKRTVAQSRQVVQRYPAQSLVIAVGLGFLTGFAIRRLTHACDKSAA